MFTCGEDTLALDDGETKSLVEFRCNLWACPTCAPLKGRRLVARIILGNPKRLWTLTWRVRDGYTPDTAAEQMVHALAGFMDAEAKRRHIKRIQYFAVFEPTEQGWPHIHLVTRHVYIDWQRFSDWMEKHCDSPVVRFDEIRDQKAAAKYLACYLAKAPHKFKGRKRAWATHDWPNLERRDAWRQKRPDDAWYIIEGRLTVIRDLHVAQGWTKLAEAANHVVLQRPP